MAMLGFKLKKQAFLATVSQYVAVLQNVTSMGRWGKA